MRTIFLVIVLTSISCSSKDLSKDYISGCSPDVCNDLGKEYLSIGQIEKASLYFKLSCDLMNLDGCIYLGILDIKRGDNAKALKHLEGFCKKSLFQGCYRIGTILGDNLFKDQALSFFLKGCLLEEAKSCLSAGELFYSSGHIKEAKEVYQLACQKGYALGCMYFVDLK
jgi:TPR repeat protein